jgi:hypothetical protein
MGASRLHMPDLKYQNAICLENYWKGALQGNILGTSRVRFPMVTFTGNDNFAPVIHQI